mgnify:CR=1 FL=1|jgi:hypothetical protein
MADNLTVKTFALGMALVALGAVGFHELDGMVAADAGGDPWVNAVYCSVITLTTVGYGDICPAAPALEGKVFLIALSFAGLGFFCGPIMDLTSSWSNSVPGGKLGVVVATLGLGVAMFTKLEGWAPMDAVYYSTITGTTIGYGDMYPQTDNGKLAAALYALIAVNVVGELLNPAKEMLTHFVTNGVITFDSVDTDHSGTIDRDEFEAVQEQMAKLQKKYAALLEKSKKD